MHRKLLQANARHRRNHFITSAVVQADPPHMPNLALPPPARPCVPLPHHQPPRPARPTSPCSAACCVLLLGRRAGADAPQHPATQGVLGPGLPVILRPEPHRHRPVEDVRPRAAAAAAAAAYAARRAPLRRGAAGPAPAAAAPAAPEAVGGAAAHVGRPGGGRGPPQLDGGRGQPQGHQHQHPGRAEGQHVVGGQPQPEGEAAVDVGVGMGISLPGIYLAPPQGSIPAGYPGCVLAPGACMSFVADGVS